MTHEEFLNGISEEEQRICLVYAKELVIANPRTVLEIGSGWGIFARVVFEETLADLITIDKIPKHLLQDFQHRTAKFSHRLIQITGDSIEKVPTLLNEFDFIFIDGNHETKGIVADLKNSWEKLKKNGVLMVDDILHQKNWEYVEKYKDFNYGVTKAFWEFVQENRDEIAEIRIQPIGHGLAIIKKNEAY